LAVNDALPFAVAYSPDGRTLAWAGRDRLIHLWDTEGRRIRAVCRGHDWTIRSIAFHPRQPVIVSAGFDGTIRFWDVRTGEPIGDPIRLEGRSSNCVAISPDGRLLAANSAPRSDEPSVWRPIPGWITIWDWETRKELRRIGGFRYDILGLAFAPDGRTLATAGGFYSKGGEVALWDVTTGRRDRGLGGHSYAVESALFSPDDQSLVSLGGAEPDHGEVRVWDLTRPSSPPVR
jgi:WD40 repeat protein